MPIKEFFRPTIVKIIIALTIFVFVPFIYYDTGIRCIKAPCPAGADASIIQYFLNAPFNHIYSIYWISFIGGLLASYILSCVIIFVFNKFLKNKSSSR